MSGTWGEWADPCIARLIGTQEILFGVRGTDKEAFATLAVPCMKADGRTIKNTGRLIEFMQTISNSVFVLRETKGVMIL